MAGRTRAVNVALLAAVTTLVVSCGTPNAPDPEPTPTVAPSAGDATAEPTGSMPPPPSPPLAAAAAGGACYLLDYQLVYDQLGLAFDVSAARERDDAQSCVIRAVAQPLPDLALTVVPINTGEDDFRTDLLPEKAVELDQLGQVGYHAAVAGSGDRGPGREVVWLAGDGKLLTLGLTLPEDARKADVKPYVDGLVELARAIDRLRI